MKPPSSTEIWESFLRKCARNDWTEQDIHPLLPGSERSLLLVIKQFSVALNVCRDKLTLQNTIQRDNTVHFFFDLGPETSTFCISVVIENDRWYFQHLEAITIDFSAPPSLPCSTEDLPNLPEQTISWIREEGDMTERVRLYNFLVQEKSREFALNWLKDGVGFFLAARAWIPYLEPRVAFLWYAAWSEARLHMNAVVVVKADADGGLIHLTDPLHWCLYRQTSHLKEQISPADYEAMFEAVWQDRAEKAGWRLQIVHAGDSIKLQFCP